MTTDIRVEARYRREDMHDPVLLSTADDVDRLIDALLAGAPLHDAALLLSRGRPRMPSGYWDHELYVGVDGDAGVGSLALGTDDGRIASVGGPDSRIEVAYRVAEHWTEFSGRSEIPLPLIREAVKEFLSSGGCVPTCIEWKPFEIGGEGEHRDGEAWGGA